MSRTAFKQCDVERLIRAAQALGQHVAGVELRPDGAIRVLTGAPPLESSSRPADDDAADELARFAKANGYD